MVEKRLEVFCAFFTLAAKLQVSAKEWAVTASPLVNFQPFFNLIVYLVASSFGVILSATSRCCLPFASKLTRPSNRYRITLPPPISLVSLGIRPFCGSLLFTEISEVLSEPLEAVSSLEDDPHAAIDVSMAPAAAMASRRRNVLFFISFSFNVDFSADYVDEKTIGHNMRVL